MAPMQSLAPKRYTRQSTHTSSHSTGRGTATSSACSSRALAALASVGWPLVELTLQQALAPVILTGILKEGRAWCRVLEFAEEFGISARFEPFALGERRGG